jgi:hypothetical protein
MKALQEVIHIIEITIKNINMQQKGKRGEDRNKMNDR